MSRKPRGGKKLRECQCQSCGAIEFRRKKEFGSVADPQTCKIDGCGGLLVMLKVRRK